MDDLREGKPVVVSSATLLSAYVAAGMPAREYRQYCDGGNLYQSRLILHADNRLREYVEGE